MSPGFSAAGQAGGGEQSVDNLRKDCEQRGRVRAD
jgi:hypothetical protein